MRAAPSVSRCRRRFWTFFAGSAIAAVSAVGIVNYLMDPYAVFGMPLTAGVNALKPRPDVMVADIKNIVGMRAQPELLILGNSRAEVGFDPESKVIEALHLRAFNAAVPGAGIQYAASTLQRFAANDHLRVAVVGLDFLDFLYAPDRTPPGSVTTNASSSTRTRLTALLSTTAFMDSIRTLLIQHERNPAILRPDGFNPMFDYREIAATEGYSVLFQQRAQESASNLARQPHGLYVDGQHGSPAYSAMREMLRTAGEKRIDLRLVIYPYHATLLGQFSRAGLWPLFERWKADVAALSDEARRRGVEVVVWDFACPNALTAEPVPAAGDRAATMRWYWEGGHFKKELGDLVLQTVFDSKAPEKANAFGFELTLPDIDRRNVACREALS